MRFPCRSPRGPSGRGVGLSSAHRPRFQGKMQAETAGWLSQCVHFPSDVSTWFGPFILVWSCPRGLRRHPVAILGMSVPSLREQLVPFPSVGTHVVSNSLRDSKRDGAKSCLST